MEGPEVSILLYEQAHLSHRSLESFRRVGGLQGGSTFLSECLLLRELVKGGVSPENIVLVSVRILPPLGHTDQCQLFRVT